MESYRVLLLLVCCKWSILIKHSEIKNYGNHYKNKVGKTGINSISKKQAGRMHIDRLQRDMARGRNRYCTPSLRIS